MNTITLYTKYSQLAELYEVEVSTLFLLEHSKALRKRNYKRANRLREAVQLIRK